MKPSLPHAATLAIGIVLGAAGWHLLEVNQADAQTSLVARFKPALVSVSQADKASVAWFVDLNGITFVCANTPANTPAATTCQSVHFPPS